MTQRGFTLLEVLIAIALFSLLGLASYQLLQRVLHSEQRIELHEQQLRSLQRALDILQRDLWQAVPRSLPDDPSRRQALIGRDDRFRLLRGGAANPLGQPRSDLLLVSHQWEDGEWWREFRNPDDGATRRQRLLQGITLLRLGYIDAQGMRHDSWPAGGGALVLPAAVDLVIDAPGYPELRRVILLPGGEGQRDE
ncbi:type II secretion system minor pseudopilin GspJ [Metapseudomonas otitidis]|uniref:type II secretion system minor pseudopilin GspJ n=1 Tax=Metapseudomonas otitidis TaxID=319939 RepID=UPI0013F612A9|nr:type II secretion system minor pseudopilin GspJ [Pseudomonas otitidis]